MSDPDGNRWEVYTVLEDIDRKADAATSCCRPQGGGGRAPKARTEGVASGGVLLRTAFGR